MSEIPSRLSLTFLAISVLCGTTLDNTGACCWTQDEISTPCLHKKELVVLFDIELAAKCLIIYTFLDPFLRARVPILVGLV